MKKVIKCLILFVLINLPFCVLALNGSITVNKSSMTLEVGKSDTFSVTATNATGKITFSSSNTSVCTVSQTSVWLDKESTKVTVKAINTGSCTISVDINGGSYDETPIITTKTINVKVNKAKSAVNTLSDLKIDGKTISGFSGTKTSYTLNNDANSIKISATPLDLKATVTGTGTKNLNYGKNTFNVVVTAENGSKKTYSIIINKKDPRSSNNNLKSLSIDKGTINFDKNITSYVIKVEHEVEEINIKALADDSKAVVKGTGIKKIKDYANEFEIIVTAENNVTKSYFVKVLRKDKDGNYGQLSNDNSVKSLIIENYNVDFDNEVKSYNLLVDENVSELLFKVEPNDSLSQVSILNNNNFKPGLNEVKVQVIAENGEINEFLFNVYKIGEIDNQKDIIEEQKDDDKINIWLIISIIEFIVIIILLIYIVKKPKKKLDLE